ncbi:MAG: PIN domain-containing protein [Caldilineaceae bacterium]|nr:PIN domain-containing protein [Anaerolineae bacterium]MCB0111779.1 PIN domain-containing protein [Caldilineaceae bacterium]MCB0124919.1 PIN domain-containing protein [Caldilineaceae bacterium]
MLHYEVSQIADNERRYRILALMEHIDETRSIEPLIIERTVELEHLGFRTYDAMHIAVAEASHVDVFLTTDDRLLRLAVRLGSRVSVAVKNPLIWLSEASNDN